MAACEPLQTNLITRTRDPKAVTVTAFWLLFIALDFSLPASKTAAESPSVVAFRLGSCHDLNPENSRNGRGKGGSRVVVESWSHELTFRRRRQGLSYMSR
jgi:hypothetical protein